MDLEKDDIKNIERFFLRLDDSRGNDDIDCNIQIDVHDVGSWILKFRRNGVIFNNRDYVFTDLIELDGSIVFPSMSVFLECINGSYSSDMKEKCEALKVINNGNPKALHSFYRKIGRLSEGPSRRSSSISMKYSRTNALGENIQPMKHGWLLKKRDIITGWRFRYVVVYPGRVEYYLDQHDTIPRDSIPLQDAVIIPPKKCSINGMADHYSLVVDPKIGGINKVLKLASESCNEEGLQEINAWFQIFQQAIQLSNNASALLPSHRNRSGSTSAPSSSTSPLLKFFSQKPFSMNSNAEGTHHGNNNSSSSSSGNSSNNSSNNSSSNSNNLSSTTPMASTTTAGSTSSSTMASNGSVSTSTSAIIPVAATDGSGGSTSSSNSNNTSSNNSNNNNNSGGGATLSTATPTSRVFASVSNLISRRSSVSAGKSNHGNNQSTAAMASPSTTPASTAGVQPSRNLLGSKKLQSEGMVSEPEKAFGSMDSAAAGATTTITATTAAAAKPNKDGDSLPPHVTNTSSSRTDSLIDSNCTIDESKNHPSVNSNNGSDKSRPSMLSVDSKILVGWTLYQSLFSGVWMIIIIWSFLLLIFPSHWITIQLSEWLEFSWQLPWMSWISSNPMIGNVLTSKFPSSMTALLILMWAFLLIALPLMKLPIRIYVVWEKN